MYSLGPNSLKDLQILSDATREIATLTVSEDPFEFAAKYGTILNPLVKRRPNRGPPPIAAPVKEAPAANSKLAEVAKEREPPQVKQEQKSTQ